MIRMALLVLLFEDALNVIGTLFFLHPRVFAPKCASCNQPILPAQVGVNMHWLLGKTALGIWAFSKNTLKAFPSSPRICTVLDTKLNTVQQ